ncbi:caspase family protein [Calothrix sp. CCY 0018]|uniref:caspase family protein n=1 Tax=Calothrix sp. CCY 0018 TaxID=3103864 RepID=UPI0039C6BA67
MSQNTYALLVGIDEYRSPSIPSLRGCVNDITAINDFLVKRVAKSKDNLHIKKLINQEATRQAIIDNFRKHLCLAQSDDTALFYFSGHGSQEQAAVEFWHLEPDRLNETLVCWDSRQNNIWDLADKEVAKLISEVAQNHPHIVVILDCCHSGGGVRSHNSEYTGVREVAVNLKERPIDDFIFSAEEMKRFTSVNNKQSRFNLPSSEYILLAACRDNEEAREHYIQKRGVFSYFLLDSLQKNDTLTYRDLFKRTNVCVRSFYPNQSPQIEATNSNYLDQPFLGGKANKRQLYFTATYNGEYGWSIDGGAIHGIVAGSENQKTRLAIFPITVENTHQLERAIAVAEITKTLPQLSYIHISGEKEELDPELTYKVVITSIPSSYLKIYFEGYDSGIKFLRQAMKEAFCGERPSLYLCEVFDAYEADFRLRAFEHKYIIIRNSDNRQLISFTAGFNYESTLQAIRSLEHIARWTNIATITSPINSSIPTDAVRMEIHQNNVEIEDCQIALEYQADNNELIPPKIAIKVTNISNMRLYCVLLNLTELFEINIIPLGGKTSIQLEPGQEAFACEGTEIPIFIPDTWKQEKREYKDILKLIVSTSDFDGSLLKQGKIEILSNRSRSIEDTLQASDDTNIDNLIKLVSSRAIIPDIIDSQESEKWDDWLTKEILITTAIPKNLDSCIYESPQENTEVEDKQQNQYILIGLCKNKTVKLIFGLTFTAAIFVGIFAFWQQFKLKSCKGTICPVSKKLSH